MLLRAVGLPATTRSSPHCRACQELRTWTWALPIAGNSCFHHLDDLIAAVRGLRRSPLATAVAAARKLAEQSANSTGGNRGGGGEPDQSVQRSEDSGLRLPPHGLQLPEQPPWLRGAAGRQQQQQPGQPAPAASKGGPSGAPAPTLPTPPPSKPRKPSVWDIPACPIIIMDLIGPTDAQVRCPSLWPCAHASRPATAPRSPTVTCARHMPTCCCCMQVATFSDMDHVSILHADPLLPTDYAKLGVTPGRCVSCASAARLPGRLPAYLLFPAKLEPQCPCTCVRVCTNDLFYMALTSS